jgi:hypothetical protein
VRSSPSPCPDQPEDLDELLDIGDTVLDRIADTTGILASSPAACVDSTWGTARVRRLGGGVRGGRAASSPSFVWGGRHPDVHHCEVGLQVAHRLDELIGISHLRRDFDAAPLQQADEPLTVQNRVVGYHDTHGTSRMAEGDGKLLS